MEPIRDLDELEKLVKARKSPTMSVAYAHDADTITAVERAVREKIINAILVGDKEKIIKICKNLAISPGMFEIFHEPDERKSGDVSIRLIVDQEADLLMKGTISTPYFLKSILNKELNLLPKGTLLSHTTIIDVPKYHKLLFASDAAMIPTPNLNEKVQMINYNINIAAKLGIQNPKVALIAANEKVSDRMPATMDAAIIAKMADRKQIRGAIVDGPLALDVAISKKACEIKGVESPINGEADILIFPNIETGNVLYKAFTLLAEGIMAGIVTGAPFPAVLVSRADSEESKYHSIMLGAALV
jgi:phosphate butyryltransferase